MPNGPGLEPSPMRAGAGQDVFESDVLSVAARHTEDWVRSRTHDRASTYVTELGLRLGQSRRSIVQCYSDVLGLPLGRR